MKFQKMFKKYIRTQEKNIRNKTTNKTKSKIVGLTLTYQYMHYIQMS